MGTGQFCSGALVLAVAAAMLAPRSAAAFDLLESYELALRQDAQYQAARAEADANREVVPMARAQLHPTVSANYGWFRNDLNTHTALQSYNAYYPSSNFSLVFRQPLYRPTLRTGYRQAQAQLTSVEATLAKSEQDTAVRVSLAYLNALLADESLRVVLTQQQSIATQLAAAKVALAAGQGSRTDIDEAQARLDIAKADEISARNRIVQARRELGALVNQPVDQLSPIDPTRLELRGLDPESLSEWLRRADEHSPDVRALRAEVEVSRIGIDKAKSTRKLTVDLIAQYNFNNSDNVLNPDATYNHSQVGVQLSVPLYVSGYVNAQVRSSLAARNASEQHLEALRRNLETEVRKQFNAVNEGVAKTRALETAERSADQVVIASQRGLEAGTRTRLDILNAEQQRSEIRLELARERIGFVAAHVQLYALCGGITLDEMTAFNRWLGQSP